MRHYKILELQNKIQRLGIRPLDVLVVGVTGAGKSTTLNSVFGNNIVKIGEGVDPETMDVSAHSLNDYLRIWDTPGLGDGKQRDIEHSRLLLDILYKTYSVDGQEYGFIDLVLVIIDASYRDMGTTYRLLNDIIVPNFQKDRILVGLNQSDLAMKCRNWNYETNEPTTTLVSFLEEKVVSIKRRILEATGVDIQTPIYYSAKYRYNITGLMDFIIKNVPSKKRELKVY